MVRRYYSNGKLLLTGEYAVLDGGLALAVPTKFGQSLEVQENKSGVLNWKSLDEKGLVWFENRFLLINNIICKTDAKPDVVSETLLKILNEAKRLNPEFLKCSNGFQVITSLSFPRMWGLGSSSTLINAVATWAEVNPYHLLWNAFSGSGYDIAAARHNKPILYQLIEGRPHVDEVNFDPPFKDKLYFIYLNKKQNSRDAIATYRKQEFDREKLMAEVAQITRNVIECQTLSVFESLLTAHEVLISDTLQIKTVKQQLFADYNGAIKSLGGWGGDFVMATGDVSTIAYFEALGYNTILRYSEMVLSDGK